MNYQIIDLIDKFVSKDYEYDLTILIQEGVLSTEWQICLNKLNLMIGAFTEEKPNQKEKLAIQSERVDRFFPKGYSEKQKEDLIVQLLESWYRKRQHEQER